MRFRRLCKQHPMGRYKGQIIYFRKSSCPVCRPGGWAVIPSAEGKMPSREACAELSAALRRLARGEGQ